MESKNAPVVDNSETWKLVSKIEGLTESGWDQSKRSEVADLIREYRFSQTSFVIARIQKLVRESGNTELSEKVYMGKY